VARQKNFGNLNYASPIKKDRDEDRLARERMTELIIVVAAVLLVILVPLVVALIRERW
jgi:hypothetical protein